MATIVTRSGKGSALTFAEGDANFTNLNTDKLENVSEDTTPQLGGDLDVNGNIIVSASGGDIDIEPDTSGNINLTTDTGGVNISTLLSYEEVRRVNNSTTGTITLDHLQGPIDYIVQTGNLTVTGLATPTVGASVTLVLNNSGGSFTITFDETNSTFYAVDGVDPTLTGFDMINLLCIDDTTDAEVYLVNSVGGFGAI